VFADKGGYRVHPVPAPPSSTALATRHVKAGGTNQNLKLFSRGNAMSGALSIKGSIQFPKPPIKIGITIKNSIINPCAVIIVLYTCSFISQFPG